MIKLFTAKQIKAWDEYTIAHEPITSIDLMERAAKSFVDWFSFNYTKKQQIYIFCGPGNNGGDGLAISRILNNMGYSSSPFIINPKNKLSKDCAVNYNRLPTCITLESTDSIKAIQFKSDDIIIDALFGSGLTRPISHIFKDIVVLLNTLNCIKLAIDIPSGQYCDTLNTIDDIIFKANHTLTFQVPKRSFFFKENTLQNFTTLDIGLSSKYYDLTECNWYVVDNFNDALQLSYTSNYISYNIEQYETIFKTSFNTLKAINNCLHLSTTKGISIVIKDYFSFLIPPLQQVIIFK